MILISATVSAANLLAEKGIETFLRGVFIKEILKNWKSSKKWLNDRE